MTTPLPPDPPNWTTRRVGKDEELQCDRCMQRIRPGRTAYVADHSGDEFPHTAVYCSPRCRHFAERPLATYLRDDGAALAARARANDDHVDLASAYDDVTVLHEDLPVVRGKIADLRAKAEKAHPDMAEEGAHEISQHAGGGPTARHRHQPAVAGRVGSKAAGTREGPRRGVSLERRRPDAGESTLPPSRRRRPAGRGRG